MAKPKDTAPTAPAAEGTTTPAPTGPAPTAPAVEPTTTPTAPEAPAPVPTVPRADYDALLERYEAARAGHDEVRVQLREVHAQLTTLRAEVEANAAPLRPVVEEPPQLLPPHSEGAWRTVAFVLRGARVYLDGALTQLKGGEIIDAPEHVHALRGNDCVVFLGVASSAALAELRAWHASRVTLLREQATELGYELFPHGVVPPKTPRA